MTTCSAALLWRNIYYSRSLTHLSPPLQLYLSEVKYPSSSPTWFKCSDIILVKLRSLFLYFQVQHNITMRWGNFLVWRGTHRSFLIMNRAAVLFNIDGGVSSIAALFEGYLFIPVEYDPVPFDTFLSPLCSYSPHNEYYPYWCLGRFLIVSIWRFSCGN